MSDIYDFYTDARIPGNNRDSDILENEFVKYIKEGELYFIYLIFEGSPPTGKYPSLIQRFIDEDFIDKNDIDTMNKIRKIFNGGDILDIPLSDVTKLSKPSKAGPSKGRSKPVPLYKDDRIAIIKSIKKNILNYLDTVDVLDFPNIAELKNDLNITKKNFLFEKDEEAIKHRNVYLDFITQYQNNKYFNPSLTPATPANEINYVTDLRSLLKNSSDPVKVAEYKAMIEEQANQIKQNVRTFDEKKIEALEQAKLEGLEISKADYLNMLQKINNNSSYSLTQSDFKQLRLLNEDRLKKWLNAYELKENNILGIGARRSTFEKDIMRLVNSDINKGLNETTKAKKLRDLTKPDQIMEFNYPYGFPSSIIKLENGSYNVHQDGKITKFGHKLSKAQQFAYNGGIYANDIKSKVQILRLDENDPLFKRAKYAWKVSN